MKKLMMLSTLFAVAVSANAAFALPSSLKMTCRQAADLVSSQGAVVLATGAYTYDRYVSSGAYCTPSEETTPAWVPTKDSASCFVGYTCQERQSE